MNVSRRSTCLVWLFAGAFWALLSPIARAEIRYTVTDLGNLGGGYSEVYGINNSGQVTGGSYTAGDTFHAFLWTPTVPNGTSGTMQDLGTLGGSAGDGLGINDSGQVTGNSYTSGDTAIHAFLWTPNVPNGTSGTMQDLGSLDGAYSNGIAINAAGEVTGIYSTAPNTIDYSAGGNQVFLYDGTMHKLGALSGTYSEGHAINATGMVTGIGGSVSGGTANDAFLWTPNVPNGTIGAMHDLGNLGGGYSEGHAINASGIVTGTSWVSENGISHAFLYDGTMHDLGTLGPGGPLMDSEGLGINASGQIVGDSDDIAFLYDAADGMVDLNTLIDPLSGWQLTKAIAINDAGQIVGYGLIGEDEDAFLLTPVPEPSSFVLTALAALAALFILAIRRSRSAPNQSQSAP